jgi:serine/threonine protein kinase
MPDSSDTLFFERYRIQEQLGTGRLATVYHAYDERLQRDVMLHVLRDDLLDQPAMHQEFADEVGVHARRVHTALIQVYDSGEADGHPYLVTEHVSGHTLKEARRLSVEQAITIISHVTSAVTACLTRNLPFPSISSRNILIVDEGNVRLMDDWQMPEEEAALEHARYRAPECSQGDTQTPASAVYSLGILLYEMLAGACPIQGETVEEITQAHAQTAIPSLSKVRPSLYLPTLDRLLSRATKEFPGQRIRDPQAFKEELDQLQQSLSTETQRLTTMATYPSSQQLQPPQQQPPQRPQPQQPSQPPMPSQPPVPSPPPSYQRQPQQPYQQQSASPPPNPPYQAQQGAQYYQQQPQQPYQQQPQQPYQQRYGQQPSYQQQPSAAPAPSPHHQQEARGGEWGSEQESDTLTSRRPRTIWERMVGWLITTAFLLGLALGGYLLARYVVDQAFGIQLPFPSMSDLTETLPEWVPLPEKELYQVTAPEGLNLRGEPGLSEDVKVIGVVRNGAQVEKHGGPKSEDGVEWIRIRANLVDVQGDPEAIEEASNGETVEGWLSLKFAEPVVVEEPAPAPEAAPVPTPSPNTSSP